jgi:hypothetical protein
VIKFVGPSVNTVTLVAITSQLLQSVPSRDYHSITGVASSTKVPEVVFTLFVYVDGDTGSVYKVLSGLSSSASFDYYFSPHIFNINAGRRNFAIEWFIFRSGTVSLPVRISISQVRFRIQPFMFTSPTSHLNLLGPV